ncbi:hypothetical protein F5Y12DRAFT_712366 [Xylaria sp. FL1777]|nr:hypothetical protein F5Y12DRAFT_712366 [Xylaria sp. FL1777]
MAFTIPERVYLQSFPAREGRDPAREGRNPAREGEDGTNKFCVSFSNDGHYPIYFLRQLFACKFDPIYNKPESFQIWSPNRESGEYLTFLMVDMDQVEVKNLKEASDDLLKIIKSDIRLKLLQNNRDDPRMKIALPRGCDQTNYPFNNWHDPNRYNKGPPPNVVSPADNTNFTGAIEYPPPPIFPVAWEGVPTTQFPAIASPTSCHPPTTAASCREDMATESPTGGVMCPDWAEHLGPRSGEHILITPAADYPDFPGESFSYTVQPDTSYMDLVGAWVPTEPDLETAHNMVSDADLDSIREDFETAYNMIPNADSDPILEDLRMCLLNSTEYTRDELFSWWERHGV